MNRICVVGASGLLGSSLVPALIDTGHEVFCLSRTLVQPDWVLVDFGEQCSVNAALDYIQPNFILNLAAVTDVEKCEHDPHLAFLGNTLVVERICSWMRVNPAKSHLIQVSTDHNYDSLGFSKEEDLRIVNHYGFSKYAGELAAQAVDATILRTNFFGKSKCESRISFSDWVYDALISERLIYAFRDVFFSPLHINTLIEVFHQILKNPVSGTFNLGSKDGLSKAEFIFEFANSTELKTSNITLIQVGEMAMRTARPRDMRMDSSKIELVLPNIKIPTLINEIRSLKDDYR